MKALPDWDGAESADEVSGVFPLSEMVKEAEDEDTEAWLDGWEPSVEELTEDDIRTAMETEIALFRAEDRKRLRMLDERPKTRADCEGGFRPCPYFSCKYNLGLEMVGDKANPRVRLAVDLETEQGLEKFMALPYTCALDVAEQDDGATLEEIAKAMSITREGVRLLERGAYDSMGSHHRKMLESFTKPE